MNLARIFRTLIILNWATAIGGAVISFVGRPHLAAEFDRLFRARQHLRTSGFEKAVIWLEIITATPNTRLQRTRHERTALLGCVREPLKHNFGCSGNGELVRLQPLVGPLVARRTIV